MADCVWCRFVFSFAMHPRIFQFSLQQACFSIWHADENILLHRPLQCSVIEHLSTLQKKIPLCKQEKSIKKHRTRVGRYLTIHILNMHKYIPEILVLYCLYCMVFYNDCNSSWMCIMLLKRSCTLKFSGLWDLSNKQTLNIVYYFLNP